MELGQRKLRQQGLVSIEQIHPLNVMLLALKRCGFPVNALISKPDSIVAVQGIQLVNPLKSSVQCV